MSLTKEQNDKLVEVLYSKIVERLERLTPDSPTAKDEIGIISDLVSELRSVSRFDVEG